MRVLRIQAFCLITLIIPGLAMAADPMTGEEIKAALSGKTCDIEKVDVDKKKKKFLAAYYDESGKRLVHIPWKEKISKRKWWVDGDKLCGNHPKKNDYCRTVKSVEGGYHLFDDGKHLRIFTNCRDGNHLSL